MAPKEWIRPSLMGLQASGVKLRSVLANAAESVRGRFPMIESVLLRSDNLRALGH